MWKLNYLPREVKDKRLVKLVKWVPVVTVVLLVAIYIYLSTQASNLQVKESELGNQVHVGEKLRKSIRDEDEKLAELTLLTRRAIVTNKIPLNVFMGMMLRNTPEDVYIFDIFTPEGNSGRGVKDFEGEVPVEGEESVEKEDAKETEESSEGKDKMAESILDRNGRGEGNVGTYREPEFITIRGSAFRLQSISHLANVLELEEYITSVKISPIENFDDGTFNYKVFELTLELGEGW